MTKALFGEEISGCKCEPSTFVPWIDVDKNNLIEGVPALTEKSKLMCLYGGIITIVPKEEKKDSGNDNEEEQNKEKNTL